MKTVSAKQYYKHISYANVYYRVYQRLEEWLYKNIFRNDSSRVFLASDEYAFRRRFELVDPSDRYEDVEASALQFPFANYWPQNSGWQPDQRLAANTAALVYLGIYEGNTKIRASSVVMDIPVKFYYDREDDARMCYEMLFFKTFNEHFNSTTVSYAGNTLEIPVNIRIENLQFNPQFKESDWLKQNRIFVVTATFKVRSYIIFPPNQPDYTEDENSEYSDGYHIYSTTEDVILNFSSNFNWKFETYCGTLPKPEDAKVGVVYVDSKLPEEDYDINESFPPFSPKTYIWDGVEKFIPYNPSKMDTSSIREDGSVIESNIFIEGLEKIASYFSATLRWIPVDKDGVEIEYTKKEEEPNKPYIIKTELVLNGVKSPIEIESGSNEYTLTDLTPNTLYEGYLCFYLSNGYSKKIEVTFNTIEEPAKISRKGSSSSLIGKTI